MPWAVRSSLFFIMATFLAKPAVAAESPPSAEIQLSLRKLGVVGSVLYVGAHPDDENPRLFAYLARERLLRTAYLSLTRGDGGQRLVGSQHGDDLSIIRTQELLAARRVDGALQFFTRARDFGYARSPEETLRVWGPDTVLADVVWVIRRFRPDVIITRFSPEVADAHGHHTASARLALHAFAAAANPSFHPEQLGERGQPWQARRIFWNRSPGNIPADEDLSDFIQLDVAAQDATLDPNGESAPESGSPHPSQGSGPASPRAPLVEYFKLLAEADDSLTAESLFGGLDFSWSRWKGTAPLSRAIARAQRELQPEQPALVIPALLQVDKALDEVPDVPWRGVKKAEVRDLVLACAGLFAEATAADFHASPGTALAVAVRARNLSTAKIELRDVRFFAGTSASPESGTLPETRSLGSIELKHTLRLPADLPLTSPYWLTASTVPGLFGATDFSVLGLPEAPSPLRAELAFDIGGRTFVAERPIVFKWIDPVAGERQRPVEVTPAVAVEPQTSVLLLPNGEARSLAVRVTSAGEVARGRLRLQVPSGWKASPATVPFALAKPTDEATISFRIEAPPSAAAGTTISGVVRAVAEVGGRSFSQAVRHIEAPHLPIQVVVEPATVRIVAFPIVRSGLKIGYLPGPGDELPPTLRQLGYEVTVLGDEALTGLRPGSPALGGFAAIVTGARAFNESEKLRAAHPVLMAYVQAGGTLVVQDQSNNRLAPLGSLGPFPFAIGRDRVTDEQATVSFPLPEHRLLNAPNKIGAADFAGWVEERGLHFASSWDPQYQAVLRMNDPGERTQEGALLWARHGRGVFIYTALSFFRQLPAGVPGACRLFANLLAAGQVAPAR